MEWILGLVLGGAALFYITAPLWSGATPLTTKASDEAWHSMAQLEIDRELGKIDEAELEELRPLASVEVSKPRAISLEALIFGARRRKRLETALEIEILIARARRQNSPR